MHHRRQEKNDDEHCLFMRMVDDRPYFPLYAVDPANEISMIDIVDSILLASSSSSSSSSRAQYGIDVVCGCHDGNSNSGDSGGGAGMSNMDRVTITPITGGLTNALYKVDYTSIQHRRRRQRECEKSGIGSSSSSSVLVRIFGGAMGTIDRDVETNTFARLCGTTTTTATAAGGTNDKLVHPALDVLGRFANGRVETYIPNMRPATVHNDLVGAVDVEKSGASAAMKKKKKEEEEEVKGVEQSPQLLLGLEVARQMARLHYGMTTTHSSSLEQPSSTQPALWKVINSWIHDLATNITNEKIQRFHKRVLHNIITGQDDYSSSPTEEEEEDDDDDDDHYYNNGDLVSYLYNEVIWLQRYVEGNFSTANCPVTFCHNDINPGNILLLVDDTTTSSDTTTTTTTTTIAPPVFNRETVCIIDYEYCDINYSMYDVANYICEYAGGNDNGIPNYDLLPSNDYQISFLHEYIRTRNELTTTTHTTHDGGMSGDDDYCEEVAQLLEQVEVFQMASCLLWGVWGILQSTTQIIDDSKTAFTFDENLQSRLNGEADVDIFDYLRYGKNRLARYRYLKQQTTSID